MDMRVSENAAARGPLRLASPTAAVVLGAPTPASVPASFALQALIHQLPSSSSDFANEALGLAAAAQTTHSRVWIRQVSPA